MHAYVIGIIFTAQPTDMEVIWGANNTVDFPCQYDGSTSIPQWIINSTVFGSLNSRLPADHYYHDHTLSVRNIKLWQNETTYQCQIVTINGPSLCAYRSTIGHLIIRCNGKPNLKSCTSLHDTYCHGTV